MEKTIEIPFGTKDSELYDFEYTIPEGYDAKIKDGKIIVRKSESEDERIRKGLLYVIDHHPTLPTEEAEMYIAWLKKQGKQKTSEEIISNPDYISPKDKALFKIATVLSQHEDKNGSPLEEIRSILVDYGINNLESNEQKHEWTPMDEQRVENLLAIIEGHGYPGEVAWLNSLKDRVQSKQGEQKHVIVPKFREGDIIKRKGTNEIFEVSKIEVFDTDEIYYHLTNGGCVCESSDNFERVEQKPTIEMKTPEESLDIDSDTYNKIVDECIYGEQKPTDRVEQFKVGDWIVNNNGEPQLSQVTYYSWPDSKIKGIKDNLESFINTATLDKQYHLWTIQDAKDGDVLACKDELILFKSYDNKNFCFYCWYNGQTNNFFPKDAHTSRPRLDIIFPATKEQRDLLFQKMKEAGYEWDSDNLELKKIEQNSAWSREDEIALGDALWCCKQAASIAKNENDMGNIWYAEKWLKSLKPKNRWKPSDEQMEALESATENCAYSEYQDCLRELIGQLKTL